MKATAVALIVAGLASLAPAGEPAPVWTKLADAPEDPAGREFRPGQLGAWCHVPELKGFILYGGRSPCFQNGMWLFDPAKREWKMLKADDTVTQEPLAAWQKAAASDPFAVGRKWRVRRPDEIKWSVDRPGAAESYGACYDPAAKVLWLLGGSHYSNGTEGPLGLWRYDPARNAFQEVNTSAGSPPGKLPVRLACDSERNLVVSVPVFKDQKEAAGTYSPATGAWKPCPGPNAGNHPAMAHDARAKLTVLFAADGKTWTFDGAAWKEASPAKSPPARCHAGMCYAPEAGGVVLVGGETSEAGLSWVWVERDKKGAIYRDGWAYDAKGNEWRDLGATGLPKESSPGRSYHCDALAYDPEAGAATLFDASIGVWALKLGAGRPASGVAAPVAALTASLTPAPAGDRLGARKLNPKIEALGDNSWVDLGLGVPGGWEVGLAYDQANRMVFRYGGCGTGPNLPGDYGYSNMLCLLDVASGVWRIRRPTHMYGGDARPINGCGRAYAYDSVHKVVWTINGVSSGGTGGKQGMFCYDPALDKFEGPFGGPHSTSTAMAYDPDDDLILLLQRGGSSHVFNVKTRTWKETARGPETTGYDQILWIPELKRFAICLRTGTGEFAEAPDYAGMGPTRATRKDEKTGKFAVTRMVTWGFDPAAMAWSDLKPKHEPQPPRTYLGVCYDSKNRVAILHGGGNAMWDGRKEIECDLSDTWVYDPKENDWKGMKPAGAPPATQFKAAAGFDTEHGVMLSVHMHRLWAYRYKR